MYVDCVLGLNPDRGYPPIFSVILNTKTFHPNAAAFPIVALLRTSLVISVVRRIKAFIT